MVSAQNKSRGEVQSLREFLQGLCYLETRYLLFVVDPEDKDPAPGSRE